MSGPPKPCAHEACREHLNIARRQMLDAGYLDRTERTPYSANFLDIDDGPAKVYRRRREG